MTRTFIAASEDGTPIPGTLITIKLPTGLERNARIVSLTAEINEPESMKVFRRLILQSFVTRKVKSTGYLWMEKGNKDAGTGLPRSGRHVQPGEP